MRACCATSSARCKTCGDEIVATVNDGVFRQGECGPCERLRYENQSELLAQIVLMRNATESLEYDDGDDASRMAGMESALDHIRDLGYAAIDNAAVRMN